MLKRNHLGWVGLAVAVTLACYAIAPQRRAPSLLFDHEVPHQRPGLIGELSRDALSLWQGMMVDNSVTAPPAPKIHQHLADVTHSDGDSEEPPPLNTEEDEVTPAQPLVERPRFWSARFDKTNPRLVNPAAHTLNLNQQQTLTLKT